MQVLDHGIEIEALELLGVVERAAHGVRASTVLVQDLEVELLGPPRSVRRCDVFTGRERTVRFVGHGPTLVLLGGRPNTLILSSR